MNKVIIYTNDHQVIRFDEWGVFWQSPTGETVSMNYLTFEAMMLAEQQKQRRRLVMRGEQ